jgi:hypothetical protein
MEWNYSKFRKLEFRPNDGQCSTTKWAATDNRSVKHIRSDLRMTDYSPEITQLQTQQALQTQALTNALEGRWTGANSVEAILYALNPALQGTLTPDPPVLSSEDTSSPKA